MASDSLKRRASDKSTPLQELMDIASEHIELRRYVYANPSTSEMLRTWIEEESPAEAAAGKRLIEADQPKSSPLHSNENLKNTSGSSQNTGSSQRLSSEDIVAAVNRTKSTNKTDKTRKKRGCFFYIAVAVGLYFFLYACVGIMQQLSRHRAYQEAAMATSTSDTTTNESVTQEESDVLSRDNPYILIDTPSKNISCEIYDNGVGCSIGERMYDDLGLENCSDRLFSIIVNSNGVQTACGREFLGVPGDDVRELQYGESISSYDGDYSCAVDESGMTCRNNSTGHGFKIARRVQDRF